MKKVLHIIAGMNAGGMETMIMNYYRNIDRNKYSFDFLINEPDKCFYEDEIKTLGGTIYRVPFQRENILKNHTMVKEIIKKNKYDVIHEHQGITYYYPLKCAKEFGVKNRIVHNHGINRRFLNYLKLYNNLFARKRICSLANNYIACSDDVANHIFTDKIVKEKEYTVLPNAIDVKKYVFNEKNRKKIRDELVVTDEKVFIHIGTFTGPKNHAFLVEIFDKYLKTSKTNDKLLLIGEGSLKENIKQIVHDKNLENNIIFLGIKNNVHEYLSCADIMLFPSLYEGIPLTAIECQAAGLILLGSNNIDKATAVSNLMKFISLDDEKQWLELMKTDCLDAKTREKYNDVIYKSKYSIDENVKVLESLYDKF